MKKVKNRMINNQNLLNSQVSCLRCPWQLRSSIKKHHFDNFTKWVLTFRDNFLKLIVEKITSILACKHAAMQKIQEKIMQKSKLWNLHCFIGFSAKSCRLSSLFAYTNIFSEVIVDCMKRIVFKKLLAMWIANFYWKTLSFKQHFLRFNNRICRTKFV
jgi:hypothetical protein